MKKTLIPIIVVLTAVDSLQVASTIDCVSKEGTPLLFVCQQTIVDCMVGYEPFRGTCVMVTQLAHSNQSLDEFEGVIIDNSLGTKHWYAFLTNDPFRTFVTGSSGIRLEGIDDKDNLHGKHVKIFGTIEKNGEDKIKVYKIQVLDSLIPKGNPPGNTTSDEFVSDFVSRRHLYDGDLYIGVRIGGHDDVGYSESEKLPLEIKNKQVTIIGTLVPTIKDGGACHHLLYKSGYILTDFDKIEAK